jgi:WS/DGAT/MGAT family acyltransferase
MAEERREREQRFERRMSDAEALMWNVEKDPWLNPSGAMVSILDRPIDWEQFCRRMRNATAKIPRLRQRVVPGLARLSPPTWMTDPEFDFDFHVRHIRLPPPGTLRQFYDLATRFYEDPFDRTRPLWLFVAVDGLEGGKGGLFWKAHHSISDGIGMVRLSELYMERAEQTQWPDEVDLDALIADDLLREEKADQQKGPEQIPSFVGTATRSIGHLWRRQAGISRRATAEAVLWMADPERIRDRGEELVSSVRSTYRQVTGGGDVPGGSPLWKERSRRRHLEALQVSLDDAKAAGKALGGTINDVFVTGAVNGAVAYHTARGADVEALNISFVISTRTDKAIGGNSFSPTRVQIPGGPMSPEERFRLVSGLMTERRAGVTGEGALSGIAGIANLLPTSVVTRVARSQASKMDFATSNLRAAPFPMYISGAQVLHNVSMGPVAGTAFNLTAVSYNGSLDIGMFLDPAAVAEPEALRECMDRAYSELIEAGGIVRVRSGGEQDAN